MDVDVRDFFTQLVDKDIPQPLEYDSSEILDQIEEIFVASFSNAYDSSDVGTATIWYPRYKEQLDGGYKNWKYHNLLFSKTGWPAFLNLTFGEDEESPSPPEIITQRSELTTLYLSFREVIDPSSISYELTDGISTWLTSDTLFTIVYNHSTEFNLSSIDDSGNKSSPVKIIHNVSDKITNQLYIAPNPVKNREFRIIWYFENDQKNVEISLYSISGTKVFHTKLGNLSLGEDCLEFSQRTSTFPQLSTGIFFCLLKSDNLTISSKFAIVD